MSRHVRCSVKADVQMIPWTMRKLACRAESKTSDQVCSVHISLIWSAPYHQVINMHSFFRTCTGTSAPTWALQKNSDRSVLVIFGGTTSATPRFRIRTGSILTLGQPYTYLQCQTKPSCHVTRSSESWGPERRMRSCAQWVSLLQSSRDQWL